MTVSSGLACCLILTFNAASAAEKPHLFQSPALSRELIAFGYAGDLWTVSREGGRAVRLTNGVGLESAPVFSPDGRTIAFTGEYDGNTDVFTIPATGGIPHRVTYHPAADVAVGWSPDGKRILFRSTRESASRYTQLFSVPAEGGEAVRLPLPMAYQGQMSPDGSHIAYSPLAPAFGYDHTVFVSWGNYRGGRASTIWVTGLKGLDSVEIPHERASDFFPVYSGGRIFFLSGRNGHIGIFSYDPGTQAVAEVLHNDGPDIRSLAGDGTTLVYDQLGEIHLLDTAGGKGHRVSIEIDADLPEVRSSIKNVSAEIDHAAISPTGLRAAVEAHGEILTVPAKDGPIRNITNTPGVMERSPAWSPDGQSIAYFSDESGLYALHVAPQRGAAQTGAAAVKKFPLAKEAAYYFSPKWSPDSKRVAFHDNRLNIYLLDTVTGKLSVINDKNVYGGFSDASYELSWSPDSKWIAYSRSMENHLHALFLYSIDSGQSTQLTSLMADARLPAFDRGGKYLYYAASTNAGASSDGLDMSSDLYQVRSNVYAVVLSADEASPIAPELDDEKAPGSKQAKPKESGEGASAPEADAVKGKSGKPAVAAGSSAAGSPAAASPPVPPTRVDLNGIGSRVVALPLPAEAYVALRAGSHGSLYFLVRSDAGRYDDRAATLSRWTLEDRKTEKLAERIEQFELSGDGEKMLLAISNRKPDAPPDAGAEEVRPTWAIAPANVPLKAGEGTLSLTALPVRVDPAAEWAQMYHEVWRIERAYFYDPNFHGAPTVDAERRYEPYVASIASRADLNYVFQEMLGEFSVGHLRGNGGAIPRARRVPGGLLGADYVIRNNRYCLAKIYSGGEFNPREKAPLAQPGLKLTPGDCILAIDGQELWAAVDIQQPLEGTAEHAVTLRVAAADGGKVRDVTVVPLASEASLRHIDWIESNRRRVDQMSGGKLAYVYLPNTGAEGFINFNRYYFSQTQKQGAIIDERFNAGGQVADYMIEVMSRHIEAYWSPRYGRIEHTPNAGIYGPKVMIANEMSGSGGDALPWLFKQAKLGVLVGKRTWGGLVGIGDIPVLMDGGHVTAPSVAFFSPNGEWDVENHGVDPDVAVEQDPKSVGEGHDPQLESAVAIALRELAAHPSLQPARPAYPDYHRGQDVSSVR
ncbi:MAG TPA: PDZ domain-containing protein [Steroidobacteraceae bacterium]|nr:PDZ domain-containing protein [Steroidobacteraceae bacterium]